MNPLWLSAPPDFDLSRTAILLRRAGLNVETANAPKTAEARAVLISPATEIVDLGLAVDRMIAGLPGSVPLLVCAPLPVGSAGGVLEERGIRTVVEPADWGADSVAERILAELILEGHIQPARCGSLRGAATAMRKLYEEVAAVAPVRDAVLLLGETGAGKGKVAEEIHRLSGRPGELMAINVAALTPQLMASELFGHKQGAFTDAKERRGLLADAGEGTVFLDEIGDLDLSSQVNLLHVLEDFRVRPVGGNQWQEIKARILLATNRNLEEDCHEGRFRRDLYERIRGLPVHVPPLRERKADIPLLARLFLEAFNEENGGRRFIPPGALDPLFRHDWPGNVRELRQVIRQAATFSSGPEGPISRERLRDVALGSRSRRLAAEPAVSGVGSSAQHAVAFNPEKDKLSDVRNRAEASYLQTLLDLKGGNKSAVAEQAGISLSRLYELLKKGASSG